MIRRSFADLGARLGARLGRFRRAEGGGGAIELVMVLPVMMGIFMTASECGLYMTRHIMLERAVDMTVRNVRLGIYDNPTHALLKTEICALATAINNCDDALRIEMRPISTTAWDLPTDATACQDRDEEIVDPELDPGTENELMLIRVCLIQDAIFPGMAFSEGIASDNDSAGGYALISVNAFVNEPT